MTLALAAEVDLTPPAKLVQALSKRGGQLRMLPAVAQEALELLSNPSCSLPKFVAVVKRDVKLTADVLKIANSALYCPVTPILDLGRCVMRIGFRECQNLIMAASVSSLMHRVAVSQAWVREALWRHSFTTALLATRLNRTLALGFQGEEFTAGLLHDFGRILFAVALPETFTEFDPVDFDESSELLEREFEATGTDHCRFGAWFARGNQLPPPITEVLQFHHQPERAETATRLTALIAVADQLANDWQRLGESVLENVSTPDAWTLLTDCMDREPDVPFAELVPALLEGARQDVETLMSA